MLLSQLCAVCMPLLSDLRQCAFKLLYSKPTWSFSGLPDGLPLAPVAKLVITGYKLFIGLPVSSAMAGLKASGLPSTMSNACRYMLNMTCKDLASAGGWWVVATPRDLVVLPGLCIVSEFNLLNDDQQYIHACEENGHDMLHMDIGQTLSWSALTQYNISPDFLNSALDCIEYLLRESCSTAATRQLQSDLQACGWDYCYCLNCFCMNSDSSSHRS